MSQVVLNVLCEGRSEETFVKGTFKEWVEKLEKLGSEND